MVEAKNTTDTTSTSETDCMDMGRTDQSAAERYVMSYDAASMPAAAGIRVLAGGEGRIGRYLRDW